MVVVSARAAQEFLDDSSKYEDDLECEFDELEVPDHIRQARMEELKKMKENFEIMQKNEHGTYTRLHDQGEFLKLTTAPESRVVCHFFVEGMARCQIVDAHLQILARKHYNTKFIKFDATECGFLVQKLALKVLPAVFCFVNGVVKERIVGFDRFKGGDNFKTMEFEMLLFESGVLTRDNDKSFASAYVSRPAKNKNDSDDEF